MIVVRVDQRRDRQPRFVDLLGWFSGGLCSQNPHSRRLLRSLDDKGDSVIDLHERPTETWNREGKHGRRINLTVPAR